MALEIILDLVATQKGRGNPVFDSFAIEMKTNKKVFTQYGHKQFADSLHEPELGDLANKGPALDKIEMTAVGSFFIQVFESSQIGPSHVQIVATVEVNEEIFVETPLNDLPIIDCPIPLGESTLLRAEPVMNRWRQRPLNRS